MRNNNTITEGSGCQKLVEDKYSDLNWELCKLRVAETVQVMLQLISLLVNFEANKLYKVTRAQI